MHFDDFPAHSPSFRIPAHVIANLELPGHGSILVRLSVQQWNLSRVGALINDDD
jgi:hypothetical protein